MGKVIHEFETRYEVGDVVIFKNHGGLEVGMIEGYYVDDGYFWFNIRISPSEVYTYSNHGDIAEHNIVSVLNEDLKDKCLEFIIKDNEI